MIPVECVCTCGHNKTDHDDKGCNHKHEEIEISCGRYGTTETSCPCKKFTIKPKMYGNKEWNYQ